MSQQQGRAALNGEVVAQVRYKKYSYEVTLYKLRNG